MKRRKDGKIVIVDRISAIRVAYDLRDLRNVSAEKITFKRGRRQRYTDLDYRVD